MGNSLKEYRGRVRHTSEAADYPTADEKIVPKRSIAPSGKQLTSMFSSDFCDTRDEPAVLDRLRTCNMVPP